MRETWRERRDSNLSTGFTTVWQWGGCRHWPPPGRSPGEGADPHGASASGYIGATTSASPQVESMADRPATGAGAQHRQVTATAEHRSNCRRFAPLSVSDVGRKRSSAPPFARLPPMRSGPGVRGMSV